MKHKILGLDIQTESVCIALIECRGKPCRLSYYAERQLGRAHDFQDGIAELLDEIKAETDFRGASCVVTLAPEVLCFRRLNVPFAEEKKIDQILPFELEPELMTAADDLAFDFQMIGKASAGEYRILAAAVEKKMLQTLIETMHKTDFAPDVVTIGCYPTALALAGDPDAPKDWLFVDLGVRYARLFIAAAGKIVFIRSFAAGQNLPLGCADIHRTLMAYSETNPADNLPASVFLSGKKNMAADLPRKLAAELDLPVQVVETADMAVPGSIRAGSPIPETDGLVHFASLCRLPAKGFKGYNFLKGPFAPRKRQLENKRRIFRSAVFALLVEAAAMVNLYAEVNVLETRAALIEKQTAETFRQTFPEVGKIRDPLHQMKAKIKDYREAYPLPVEFKRNRLVIDVLNEISRKIARNRDVVLTKLVVGRETVSLSGSTNSFNTVDEIKSRLGESNLFNEVMISSANFEKKKNRVYFKLRIRI